MNQSTKQLSAEEILAAIKGLDITVDQFAQEDFDQSELEAITGPFKEVDSYGGEGQGETWWRVIEFSNHNVCLKVDGFYTSYDGVSFYDEWDHVTEVKQVTKTVTVYE